MSYISIERMLREGKTSLYKLTLAAAGRANELSQGSKPLVESDTKKATTQAMQEIAQDQVHYEITTEE